MQTCGEAVAASTWMPLSRFLLFHCCFVAFWQLLLFITFVTYFDVQRFRGRFYTPCSVLGASDGIRAHSKALMRNHMEMPNVLHVYIAACRKPQQVRWWMSVREVGFALPSYLLTHGG
ncbi:hypothetical protein KIL84_002563 [Mauremys mutica]|uniref:Uncharacterized protein n=1 Tax=Mauremys mutica TaxID=74926 RepID=A0A9D4AYD8_9SAUR|nr:hypothetical protein KIL84_002563 [Mauremys mutica]